MVKKTKVRYNIGQLNTFLFRNTQERRKKSKFSTSKPNYFFYNFTTNNPRNKAIQKLMNVPATTYSDFSDSLLGTGTSCNNGCQPPSMPVKHNQPCKKQHAQILYCQQYQPKL